ncbi:glycerophosphodiester phosphodiesterase family protein [Vitreimonas flagellata]|uniref:glycerophosphodiester phosphodiesterase family protein n=1 Tax=Vitreimonas flagellata TaxID=2560861 RepID=UPI0010752209|nr:glycerophosphodiester phosphodiesterase family protein [Vitreimonas flagellata]
MRRRDVVLGAATLAGCASMSESTTHTRPIVIAHRGASAFRPEHTLAAYRLAIAQGADFIEPDLVMTRDGVLVCRHENEISGTTDVAQQAEFADRRKEKVVDGVTATGWWVEDFTLAELKTLRCIERIPQLRQANTAYNGQEQIPTFVEVLALAAEHNVGAYPELKHPTFLREQGLDPVPAFIAAVREAGGQRVADRLFVQCFEIWPLPLLAQMSSLRWQCVQLVSSEGGPWDRRDLTYAQMLSDDGLRRVAEYARGLGPEKSLVIPRSAENLMLAPTDLVTRAHAANLVVHPWTFRPENYFLANDMRAGDASSPPYLAMRGDVEREIRAFIAVGVDGVFSDDPAAAVAARG